MRSLSFQARGCGKMRDTAEVDDLAQASHTCRIFAYGSLMWRPCFNYKAREAAYVLGYVRRFWQTSDDHRGTAEAPGRVVCLVTADVAEQFEPALSPGTMVWGYMYTVDAEHRSLVLSELDKRERNGYTRTVTCGYDSKGDSLGDCCVYVCCRSQPAFKPCNDTHLIAAEVVKARGESGPNIEYVLKLNESLEAIGISDEHVNVLAALCYQTAAATARLSVS
jgi:glutathione-specific gamma-glutamylcyclotransferase